jgi:hypothetical protein
MRCRFAWRARLAGQDDGLQRSGFRQQPIITPVRKSRAREPEWANAFIQRGLWNGVLIGPEKTPGSGSVPQLHPKAGHEIPVAMAT